MQMKLDVLHDSVMEEVGLVINVLLGNWLVSTISWLWTVLIVVHRSAVIIAGRRVAAIR